MLSRAKYLLPAGLALLALTACEVQQPVVSAPAAEIPQAGVNDAETQRSRDDKPTTDETESEQATIVQSDTDVASSQTKSQPEEAKTNTALAASISKQAAPDGEDISPDLTVSEVSDAQTLSDGEDIAAASIDTTNDSSVRVTDDLVSTVGSEQDTAAVNSETIEIASLQPKIEPPKVPIPKNVPKAEPVRIVPKKPVPPPPPPLLQPATLVGLTHKNLLAELGEADFVRLEGQMQIWQYKTDGCITDFFLYPADDIDTNPAYLVTDWYSRARLFGTQLDIKRCFEDLGRRSAF